MAEGVKTVPKRRREAWTSKLALSLVIFIAAILAVLSFTTFKSRQNILRRGQLMSAKDKEVARVILEGDMMKLQQMWKLPRIKHLPPMKVKEKVETDDEAEPPVKEEGKKRDCQCCQKCGNQCSRCLSLKNNQPCYFPRCSATRYYSLRLCGLQSDAGSSKMEQQSLFRDPSFCDCPQSKRYKQVQDNEQNCDPYQWRADVQSCSVSNHPYVSDISIFPILGRSVIACYGESDLFCKEIHRSAMEVGELSGVLAYALRALKYARVRKKWTELGNDVDNIPPAWIAAQMEVAPNVKFIDIGANVGVFSYLMFSLGFDVFAFEPMPHNIQLLRTSRCLNDKMRKLDIDLQSKLSRNAVSDGDGTPDVSESQEARLTEIPFLSSSKKGKMSSNTFNIYEAALGDIVNKRCIVHFAPSNHTSDRLICNQRTTQGTPEMSHLKQKYVRYTTLDSFAQEGWNHKSVKWIPLDVPEASRHSGNTKKTPADNAENAADETSNNWQYQDYVLKIDARNEASTILRGAEWFLTQIFRPKMVLVEVWKGGDVIQCGDIMVRKFGYIGFSFSDRRWLHTQEEVEKFHKELRRETDTIIWLLPEYIQLMPAQFRKT